MKAMSNDSWYVTLGYRFGKTLPFFTYQDFENDTADTDQQVAYTITSVGVSHQLMKNTVLKAEVSRFDNDKGTGLFDGVPTNTGDITKIGLGLNWIF